MRYAAAVNKNWFSAQLTDSLHTKPVGWVSDVGSELKIRFVDCYNCLWGYNNLQKG